MTYNGFDDESLDDIPSSAAVKVIRHGVQDDADPEAIEWSEIQRLLFERDWAPILALRQPATRWSVPKTIDENGHDVSAFNTGDFERLHGPRYDRFGYAIDHAKRERDRALWMMEMLFDRIPGKAKYVVLKYLERGVIDESMIANHDLQRYLYWSRRHVAAMEKITRIRKARWQCGGR
jgi:hypothetical protein